MSDMCHFLFHSMFASPSKSLLKVSKAEMGGSEALCNNVLKWRLVPRKKGKKLNSPTKDVFFTYLPPNAFHSNLEKTWNRMFERCNHGCLYIETSISIMLMQADNYSPIGTVNCTSKINEEPSHEIPG